MNTNLSSIGFVCFFDHVPLVPSTLNEEPLSQYSKRSLIRFLMVVIRMQKPFKSMVKLFRSVSIIFENTKIKVSVKQYKKSIKRNASWSSVKSPGSCCRSPSIVLEMHHKSVNLQVAVTVKPLSKWRAFYPGRCVCVLTVSFWWPSSCLCLCSARERNNISRHWSCNVYINIKKFNLLENMLIWLVWWGLNTTVQSALKVSYLSSINLLYLK